MGWDYCCCAIPVLNVGAYLTLSEQFVLGILVGTLSFATPSLVGSSVPFSFANLILCGLGYAFAIVQLFGFVGIFKEKPALFRRYVAVNWILLYIGLSVAASYLGISASRHSAAVTACESTFFAGDSTSTTVDDTKGEQICNIFTWATLGVMGALWVLVFIVQTYLVFVLRNYGASQRADHTKYHSIYSAHDGADNIMLNNVRSGTNGEDSAWDTRPSTDSWHPRADNGYRDNESVQYQIPPAEKGAGYGVGVGSTSPTYVGPSKQASVDQAYLEHPSKAAEAAAVSLVRADTKSGLQSGKFYDGSGAPPSYHGHDDSDHLYHDQGSPKIPTWEQQAFHPYIPQPAHPNI